MIQRIIARIIVALIIAIVISVIWFFIIPLIIIFWQPLVWILVGLGVVAIICFLVVLWEEGLISDSIDWVINKAFRE